METHVLSIGYGRQLFESGNMERERLRACAEHVASLHQIVFSRRSHRLRQENVSARFFLVPTNSYFGIFMIFDAIRLGRRIMRSSPRGAAWCVTSQDPLGSGIAGYILSKIMRCPFVVQEHGDIFSGEYWKQESFRNHFWYHIARFIIRRADRVRVVSNRVRRHVADMGVADTKIQVLPVFSDLAVLSDAAPAANARAFFHDASVVVLSAGRFVPQKNLPLLLAGFASLLATDPRARLLLVGAGPLQGSLEREIELRGIRNAVCIVPWTPEVISLMRTADIYALSSNYEGWARVLVEAMACGLPAVTTDVGCVGEVFLDGRHGLVVPIGDETAFGRALVSLAATDKRATFRGQGAADAIRTFSDRDSYMRQWASVFSVDGRVLRV